MSKEIRKQKTENSSGEACAAVRAELAEAQKKVEEHLVGWQRATADYQNLQKQVTSERTTLIQFANEAFVTELLPVLDNANQALQTAPEAEGPTAQWITGMRHVLDGLWQVLKTQGLEEIAELVGSQCNPEECESVALRTQEGTEPGVVLEIQRPGYRLHGRVLRPAQVIISE